MKAAYLDLMGVTRWAQRARPNAAAWIAGVSADGRWALVLPARDLQPSAEAHLTAIASALGVREWHTWDSAAALVQPLASVSFALHLAASAPAEPAVKCQWVQGATLTELVNSPVAKAALWHAVHAHGF